MKKSFLIAAAVCICASAIAADIVVKATVTGERVALGSAFQYTITVTGAQGFDAPAIAAVDGFDVRYSGPATRVSVVNGAYSVEQSFNYIFTPLKEGKFTIPALPVDVKGQSFMTEPIGIEVLAAGVVPAGGGAGQDIQQEVESRLKLLMAPARDKAYLGEAIPFSVRLYVNQLSMQDLAYPEIPQDGFILEPFGEPRQFQDTLEGVNWHVVEFTTLLYPSRTGKIIIPPALVKASLLFKNDEGRRSGSIFDEGFFSNFFSSYQKRPVTVTSRSSVIDVLPLPEEGRPAGFSGAVGQFELAVEAAPLKVKAGDPVTLRMVLTGSGNIKALEMPVFQADGFKVYDPQIKDEAGKKTLEQVVAPTDVNAKQIPAVRFSYFDTASGVYRAIERGPFPLEVSAPEKGEEFQAVGFTQLSGVSVPETLGRDIVFIKDDPGHLQPRSRLVARRVVFYVALAVYVQLWAGFLAFYFYRRRTQDDPKFVRQMAAARRAYAFFKEAEACLKAGEIRGFYDALERGLRGYFVERLELAPGNTDIRSVEAAFGAIKVDAKCAGLVEDIYAAAEQVRFAGMVVPETQMRTHLADAEDIIKAVERRAR